MLSCCRKACININFDRIWRRGHLFIQISWSRML
ncbi:hypothetical protein Gohar_002805 [Gossypium harknessii]|uniref:Uncharacterized protein n=1 Tax=Gossypium harknessii TaxID=34285 RepID=A0A7J9HLY2_9ROSI|nr:hypothetical protein [Gossypium harknessii]